ncbi:polysaccharide biosynthesis/export family protein [Neorhizobium alkalisoli]|uniref:Polysaccharide export outer membrane protein n=1 Tax=Neorhizobium alkalisoli TaxID=528178 RepID=A0A561QI64_9HYPH|nr:polysaccharide biosynthesis/export family protein [Neorhizobium alkalisoli]TWF50055.1 polysaccharide export outer membrane protein [Neorhizobium alkalisoli]
MRKLTPLVFLALLTACASPSDGPGAGSFYSAKDPRTGQPIPVTRLANAPMTPVTATPLAYAPNDPGLSKLYSGGFADTRLRKGDVIEVTILDTGEDGLFSSTQAKTLNLGRFTVDSAGSVTLPFVGKQRVLESSPEALQQKIVSGLKGSAVNPQAVVTVVDKPSSGFTVNGDVRSAGRFPLTARKERVLDGIALAGGSSSAASAASVTVIRGKQRATAPLQRVIDEDRQNVYLLPDDQVFVGKDAPSFTAFGAFKSVGEFEFEPGKMTLMQAFSRAGGLLDDRADASNFYVVRNQQVYGPVSTVNGIKGPAAVTTKPAIYRVDMNDVSNLSLMQRFQIMDGDILYASNSKMVDFAKLFTIYQKSAPTAAAPLPGSN